MKFVFVIEKLKLIEGFLCLVRSFIWRGILTGLTISGAQITELHDVYLEAAKHSTEDQQHVYSALDVRTLYR